MSFEELLKKKLGPMRDLVRRPVRGPPPQYDPERLWYRRAAGLELRMHPDETWASLQIGRGAEPRWTRLSLDEAEAIMALTDFRPASACGLPAAKLWEYVAQDLLFFSQTEVSAPLSGVSRQRAACEGGLNIARRASAWPTMAVETTLSISPMPFMPRGRDLAGAALVGARFASLERGFEVMGATITGGSASALRTLLPLLDGRRSPEQVLQAIADRKQRTEAQKLMNLLDRLTLLEARAAPPGPDLEATAPQITWLGHAGVLIQTPKASVLVDPLFFSISEPELPHEQPRFDPRALPKIDAVFITHGDNDHLNPNSLAMLPVDTPIYIPRVGAQPAPYQVDMGGMLQVLGFQNIYQLDEGTRATIKDIRVTAYPFVGESWGLDLAKLTYLVEADDKRVFCSADAALMPETYRMLDDEGPVDLALMGVSGCAESYVMPQGLGYGNFYQDWVPKVQHNEWVQHCAGPKEALESLEIFEPRYAFGYAAGGAPYIRTEFSDTGNHAQLAELLRASKLSTRPVQLPLGVPVFLEDLPKHT